MKGQGYLGLDLGGTAVKAGVVDSEGRLLELVRRSYQVVLTPEGHAEIPIKEVYEATRSAATQAVRNSGMAIAALSIASQGQTFVPLNAAGEPLHPAIVWYDSRASAEALWLRQALDTLQRNGPLPSPTPIATVPKIMWLREHCPARMAQAKKYLLLPDFFTFRLTGRAVTDPCTAASTGAYAEDAADYCAEALALAGIAKDELSEIQLPGRPVGRVLARMGEEWGLTPQTLVVTGTNDQYAGALGAGNCRPGIVSVAAGTCLALVSLVEHLPDPLPPGLWRGRFPIARYQCGLAYAKTAGAVLDWFQRQFSPDASLRELDREAAAVPVGSRGVVSLLHFDGMVSPAPNPSARGAFLNLSLHHTRAEMYRALLEAFGFTLRENLEFMAKCGFRTDVVRTIGGAAQSDNLMQINADITGFSIERPMITEAAVLGVALLAAVGAGHFATLEEASERLYRRGRVFAPDPQKHVRYEDLYSKYMKLRGRVYRQSSAFDSNQEPGI
jgi:xylulokinase